MLGTWSTRSLGSRRRSKAGPNPDNGAPDGASHSVPFWLQGNRLKVPGPLHWGIGLPNPSSRACPGDQDKHKLAIPCPYWSPGQALPGSHILGTTFRRLPSARMKTRRRGKCPGNPAPPRLRCPIGLCLGVGNGSSTAFNPEVPETQRPRVHELWVSGTSGTSGLKT